MTNIVLQKGDSIKFLDYVIKNSLNNDGLVLCKEGTSDYQCHLGNYGEGTQENIDYCKRHALIHFMLARPGKFAKTIVNKLTRANSGTYHEYFLLKNCLIEEGIEIPKEITCGDGINCMIYFNNKPIN